MPKLCRALFVFLIAACVPRAQISFDPQGPEMTPPPSNTPPDQKCVVQGRVTNSQTGEALKKATLRLARRSGAGIGAGAVGVIAAKPMGAQGYSAVSQADGSFRIEGIEPGDYTLYGEHAGYLNTAYGAKSPSQPGTVLSLRPGQQTTDIVMALIPQAVIAGKVVDEDGDPVASAMIQVLGQTWQRGKLRYLPHGGGQTNDLGEYRSASLSPGSYYVCAQKMNFGMADQPAPPAGKPDLRPVRSCYPDAMGLDNATLVTVRAGQDASGIDIRMHSAQTYHVRGKVAGVLPDTDSKRVNVTLARKDEQLFFMGNQAALNKDQTFDIAGVAPGSYMINVLAVGGGPMHGLGRQPVEVGQGDVNDLVVPLTQPGTLRGQVRVEGTPPAGSQAFNFANVSVRLQPGEDGGMFGSGSYASAKADGTFTLENVTPGKYRVHVSNPPAAYLRSVRFGQEEVSDRELDLSQSASGDLEVVLRYGPAEVDGTLQTQNASNSGTPTATAQPAMAVLMPADSTDPTDWRFANANQNGTFIAKQLRPGRYRIYAFEQANMGELQNPEVLKALESKGTEVELKENDRKQIQLTPISTDELQQIFARLGIESPQ